MIALITAMHLKKYFELSSESRLQGNQKQKESKLGIHVDASGRA